MSNNKFCLKMYSRCNLSKVNKKPRLSFLEMSENTSLNQL